MIEQRFPKGWDERRVQQLIAERSDGFTVRKTGFESFVYVASRQYPLVYGLVCVALALFTGWLAGVVFRR